MAADCFGRQMDSHRGTRRTDASRSPVPSSLETMAQREVGSSAELERMDFGPDDFGARSRSEGCGHATAVARCESRESDGKVGRCFGTDAGTRLMQTNLEGKSEAHGRRRLQATRGNADLGSGLPHGEKASRLHALSTSNLSGLRRWQGSEQRGGCPSSDAGRSCAGVMFFEGCTCTGEGDIARP